MGMRSTFITQEITVKKGMRKALSKFKNSRTLNYPEVFSKGTVDFGAWDGYKIENYWYLEMIDFLRKIATMIDGFVEFACEKTYHFRIVFKNGKVYAQYVKEVIWGKTYELKDSPDQGEVTVTLCRRTKQ